MADYLSKVKIGETIYDLKDADSRTKLSTLLGDHAVEELGAAAWKAVETTVANDANLPTGAAVQTYVAGEIGKIVLIKYQVVETLPTASADTEFNKSRTIYLVKDSTATGSDIYSEYITVDKGAEADPRYVWEKLGDTRIDLSDYVKKTEITTGSTNGSIAVAGTDVAVKGLDALAYKSEATGTVAGQTITNVKASYTPAGTITVNALTQTSTAASLTKGDFTPAGSITGSAISGGSIAVTVKDATEATAVTNLEYENYTPAGSIAATTGGSFSALKSATFGEDSANGVQIEGTVSKPAITVNDDTTDTFVKSLKAGTTDAASFTEGAFTAASYDAGFLSTGARASFTQGAKASLTDQATASFAKKVLKPAIASDDAECLVFNWVADDTAAGETGAFSNAVTDRGTFTANGDDSFTANTLQTLDSTKFHGGSKAADTFSAEKLPVVDGTAAAVTAVSAELAEAPAFTGKKYKVATTDDTALKEVAFTGTAAAIKLTGAKYLKQEINTATFTPEAATLGFSGTKAENVLITAVSYDKATANGATFAGTAGEATVGDIVVADKNVTVS